MNDTTHESSSGRIARAVTLWMVAALAGAAGMYLVRQGSPRVSVDAAHEASEARPAEVQTPGAAQQSPPGTVKYTPPPDRSPGMQAFDKALLYIAAQQETDGHWSARKTGAAEEYCNENGDIALTAVGTYALMSAIAGDKPDAALVDGSKRGMRWLRAKVRDDGSVIAKDKGGPVVVAQIFTSLAFLQAATMSPREDLLSLSGTTARYAFREMMAKSGGFGEKPGDEHALLDVSSLGQFLYAMAFTSGIRFSTTEEELSKLERELQIEKSFQSALRKMRVSHEKKDGVFRMSTAGGEADFDATVVALLGQLLGNIPPKEYTPGFGFILGTPDTNGEFPGPGEKLAWGKEGEGYRALPMWLGTLGIALHGDKTQEYRAWRSAFEETVLKHQLADGSWPVAGSDARYGKIWRTALTSFSLNLLNPAPPPKPPPPDEKPGEKK
ncbi:MAG TPA: hypothetical protein VEJ63_19535 [Planctomycetota bacterium]|nr:hypothetical protein [Planctomycetota bacterium]